MPPDAPPTQSDYLREVSAVGIDTLKKRGASPELIRAAQRARRRKASIRLRWPTVPYSVRWEPDVDSVTGQDGHGLLAGLRVWWQVRRGTWQDDEWDFGWDDDDA